MYSKHPNTPMQQSPLPGLFMREERESMQLSTRKGDTTRKYYRSKEKGTTGENTIYQKGNLREVFQKNVKSVVNLGKANAVSVTQYQIIS